MITATITAAKCDESMGALLLEAMAEARLAHPERDMADVFDDALEAVANALEAEQ